MKKILLLFKKTSQPQWLLTTLMLVSFMMLNLSQAQGQCPPGAVCASYSTGDIASDFDFNSPADFPAACLGSVSVTIPAGNWVDSVSTSYDMTAANGAWMSEQRTWLYSPSTAVGEPNAIAGTGLGGTQVYNRTGLSFANTATGTVNIELHVGRTWGGSGCDPSYNKVDNNTWDVIVYHSPAPSCLPPSSPSLSSITANGLIANWTTVATAVDYDYEVRTSGAAGSGPTGLVSSGTVTADSAVVTGLSPSTSFDFYLRTNCSGTAGSSPWTSAINFTTPIQGPLGVNCITGLPGPIFTEDFESSTPSVTGLGSGAGNWNLNTGGTSSGATGPLGAHQGNQYVYFETSGSNPLTNSFVTNAVDLTTANDSAELSFWIHAFGATMGTLNVGVGTSATGPFTQVFTSTGAIQAAQGDPWQNVGIRLDSYVGQTIYLEFDYTSTTSFTGDIALDLIEVTTCVTCPNPSNPTFASATATTAGISWTGSASQFEVEYGTIGYTPGTGTSATVTGNSYTITGLTANTGYDVFVRSDCSAGSNGFSGWVGPVTIQTLCTVFTAPFIENFDGTTWVAGGGFNNANSAIDPCWNSSPDVSTNNEPFRWVPRSTGPSSGNGPLQDVTGGNFLYVEASGSGSGDSAWIQTPAVDVSGLTTPAVYFEQHRFSNGSSIADLKVLVSNDFGATWTQEYSVTGEVQTASGDPYQLVFVNLGSYSGDTILVRFQQDGNGCCGDAAIDKVEIKEAPTCPWPTGQSLVGVTDTTATLGWNDPTGTNWDIEWGPIGFAQGTGSVTSVTNDTTTFGPLSPNTCYDVYVRANCTGNSNGVSIWRGPIQFCTQCSPFTAPYTQNYDATTAPELDNCWSPLAFNPSATNFELQTDAFRNFSPPNSMEIHNASATSGWIGIASPRFSDLDTNKRIEFQVYDEDGQFGGSDLIVGVMSDLSNETTFEAVDTIFEVDMPDDVWDFVVVDLTGHTVNNGGHVVFRHGMNTTFDNIHVDDFSYDEIPSCQAPLVNTLGVTGVSTTNATALWGSGSQGVKTYFAWGSVGFVPGVAAQLGIDSVAGTVDQGLISGLSPQTTYEFYIQDSCVGAGLSPWVGPFTFTTPCLPATMPYYESFDTWALACWDSAGGNAFWQPYNASAGNQYARADFWANSTGIYYLTSRPIAISIDAQLRFDWSHLYSSFYDQDQLLVLVKTLSATTWDTVLDLKGPNNFNDPTAGNFNTPGNFITEEVILDPVAYTGDTIQVQLIGISDWGPDLFLNDLYVEAAPTCPKLINVGATGITSNSATLNWNASGNAVSYDVWYGPQGFFQGTLTAGGTRQFVTPDSLIVSNFTPQTCYEYLVRAVCAPGDTSDWVGPVIFCTPCAPFTAPYVETFDGIATGLSGDFSNCWTGVPEVGAGFPQNYAWESSAGPTPNFNTGPDQDVSGSGNFLFTRSNNGSVDDLAELYSPTIDITALSTPEVRFSYHMFGNNIDTLHMDVHNGTSWTNNVFTIGGAQQTSTSAPWADTTISLASFSSATNIQVRFRAFKDAGFGSGDIAIDEFFVDDPLTCFRPDSIQLISRTQTSITLDWNTGGSTNWQVAYDTLGGTLAGATLAGVTTKPYTVTGLNSGTGYQFWVRDSCGPGDVSFWRGPFTANTDCPGLAPLILPYTQDFENLAGTYQSLTQLCDGADMSLGFSNTDPSGRLRFEAGPGFVNSGSKAATLDRDPSGSIQINYLVLTADMSNYIGSNAVLLDFYFMHHGEENHPNDRVWVRGSQADTWIQLYDTYANRGSSGAYNYVDSLDISGILAANSQSFSSSFQIRLGQEDNFPATSTTASDGFTFDDFTIYDTTSTPPCVSPSALAHNTIRCDSVEVSWSSSAATIQTVLEYGAIGFTPGTGTLVANASSPQLLSGLTASTDYDVYVVDICATDTSAPVGPYTFNTGTVGAPVAAFSATQQGATLTSQDVDFDASATTGSGNSYAWDFGDGNSATGAVFTHSYLTNNTFTVTLIVTNACGSDTLTQTITTSDISLTENALGRSLNVFPNPASDVVNVSFETMNSGDVRLRLVDVQGREIMVVDEKVNGSTYQKAISVKALSSGMYILEVQSGDLKARRAISVK